MNVRSRSIAAILSAVLSTPAAATVVDFDSAAGAGLCTPGPITADGYTFTPSDFFQCLVGPGEPAPNANNGTAFLSVGSQFLTMSQSDGDTFAVRSLDLGTSYYNNVSPNLLTLVALRSDNSTISQTLTVSNSFASFDLEGFDDLVSLTFGALQLYPANGDFGYFALDNIVVDAGANEVPPDGTVPLPGTVALGLAGLAALAFAQRRRGSRAAASR